MSVVSLKSIHKQFGKGGVTALDGIDLEIGEREFVSLIGPSGCGKSTLLRIIGDLIQPSSGDVVVNGKSAHQARLDRDYGIVFQDAVLYDWRVSTTKPWMNALGPVARPVFEYNHDVVMRWGGEGLARRLGCRLLATG